MSYANFSDKTFVPTPVIPKPSPVSTPKPVEFQEALKKATETAQRLLAQSGSGKVSITLATAPSLVNKIAETPSAPSTVPPPVNRPPKPGKQETKPKVSNLASFMNELKTWVSIFHKSSHLLYRLLVSRNKELKGSMRRRSNFRLLD